MLKLIKILLLLFLSSSAVFSQVPDQKNFQSPLDIPLFLSGNFGELRSSHFHAGIDLKTGGVTGKQVLSAYDGYVSRIKIQAGGYGRSIYISHPNGYTTVYGHLERYIPVIQDYVVKQQYQKKSYELNIFPPKGMFRLKKGEQIAFSGNTGRSGGPHLHFEIRRSDGQIALNVLKYNFPIKDNLPPVFKNLYTYIYRQHEPNGIQFERLDNPVVKINDTTYSIVGNIEINGTYLGLGVEIYDFLNGSSNKCGVYSMQLNIDNEPVHKFQIDEISFSDTRFINAHMDYDLKINNSKSVHRLFSLPNNSIPLYSEFEGNGIYALKDFRIHEAEVIATDAYGNKSFLLFMFSRKKHLAFTFEIPEIGYLVDWQKGREIEKDHITINIPPKALYQDINLSFNWIKGYNGFQSDTLIIHDNSEPLHKNISVDVIIDNPDKSITDKLLFARVAENSKIISGGGEYIEGRMHLETRNFGRYVIAVDTIAPEIKAVNFINGKKYLKNQGITFTISDDLSGIESYNGYIDGKWALFTFDAKTGVLNYSIDSTRLKYGITHNLKIVVVDGKKNSSTFEGIFIF